MAGFIIDAAFDAALNEIKTNATVLHICSSQPADYSAVAGVSLGTKTPPAFTGPADHTSGRKITVTAITDGTATGTGTASHYAIVDGSRLLSAQALSATQAVTSGNTFTLGAIIIAFPDPTV
jgi:hypothetical protein